MTGDVIDLVDRAFMKAFMLHDRNQRPARTWLPLGIAFLTALLVPVEFLVVTYPGVRGRGCLAIFFCLELPLFIVSIDHFAPPG